ncbi:hypothetical protein HHK36_031689 [Tetracentron sinense]|uniref:EGF-like domain-containing protein n=1 Tax=Tetracentron sinense TaxID=13715 RepID=A0A835D091_TETSI|nr:hypothetical protein HHK36_031689 [Tetracentron sinense]
MNNGGCWSESRNGNTFSACSKSELTGCCCPYGFRGDGHKCEDIIECKEGLACQCDGCTCKNTWGGYDCECKADLLYIMEQDTCIGDWNKLTALESPSGLLVWCVFRIRPRCRLTGVNSIPITTFGNPKQSTNLIRSYSTYKLFYNFPAKNDGLHY